MLHPLKMKDAIDLTKLLVEKMAEMDGEQRTRIVGLLAQKYCPHCGGEQPKWGSCQCENDE